MVNSFLILLMVGDWRSRSLPELVRPVVEVASKAERERKSVYFSFSELALLLPALEAPAPRVSARLASRA